jgi:hypothetical protein
MAKTSVADNRKALNYATELRIFAKRHAPDPWIEHQTHKVANLIQREYGTTGELKRAYLLKWMATDDAGESISRPEITEHFGWHHDLVERLLTELLAEPDPPIRILKQQTVNPGPKGGRKATRYCLTSRNGR